MTLKQVTIIKGHVPYTELKELSELLQSNDIRNNGKVVVKCNLECEILQIRKEIKELLDVSYTDITCVYMN